MADDFVQQGKLLLQRREFAEVVRVCRLGLLSKPGLVDGRLLLGTALLALRRYDEVLAEMRVAGEIARDHLLVHVLRGEALLRKGDAEAAVEALAQAVEIDSQNPVARKLYAEARSKAGLDELPRPSAEIPARAETRETMEQPTDPRGVGAIPSSGQPVTARRRRIWLYAGAAALALAVVAAGLLLWMRGRQADEERGALRISAERAAAEQTYAGWLRARELYTRMAQAGDVSAHGPLARLRAAVALELGERLPDDGYAGGAGRDGQLAAIYQTLAAGDRLSAARMAAVLESQLPEDAEVAYAVGRTRVAAGDSGGIASLRRSIQLQPTPLAYLALAGAELDSARGGEALRACDAALALVRDHPAAFIMRARVLAALGKLPPAAEADPDARLFELTSDGALPAAQRREAQLALAEVKLARGKPGEARDALHGIADAGDPRAGELMVSALLGAGDVAAAREEAERWRAAMPGNDAPLFWLARVALADENLDSARSLLAIAGDGEGLTSGLLARGEAELLAGNLGNATAQLDRALALRPGDPTATTLRARVDLAANDPAAVEARLTPLHESGVAPEAGALLGEALRRLGERARARAVLEETLKRLAAAGARPAQTAGATVALARLDHDAGRLAEAQEAVARVLAARPRDVPARLLSAQLLHDLGDAQSARAALDNLAVTAHADPEVLIEAARMHSLTGDPIGARQLLDDASKLAGALTLAQARESARVALVEGRAQDAVDLLAGEAGDAETTLLLLDARLQIAGSDLAAAEAVAADASRRFAGQAVESVAAGQVALARRDGLAARAAFVSALARREAAGATPRELAETHLLLGQAHELAGAPDEAMASFQRAASLTPSAAAPGFFVGRAMLARGDSAGALDTLARAVKADPAHAEARFRLAEAAVAQRRPALARQALEAYLELAPHGPFAERAHKMLRQI